METTRRMAWAAIAVLSACSDEVPCDTEGARRNHDRVCECPAAQHEEPLDSDPSRKRCVSDDETGDASVSDAASRMDSGRGDGGKSGDGATSDANRPIDGDARITDAQTAPSCVATAEKCDGHDDDCDGVVDNGVTNACGGCEPIDPAQAVGIECSSGGQGVCDLPGKYTCVGGTTVCSASSASTPIPEFCDGMDNDCDGVADDGVLNLCDGCGTLAAAPGTACNNGLDGECRVAGVYACVPTKDAVVCNAPAKTGIAEFCDGKDNDCDGVPDNGAKNECGMPCSATCPPPVTVTMVSAGDQTTCAVLSSGIVKCWGSNGDGEVGDGFTLDRNKPTPVSGLTNATQVSVGRQHACAVLADTTVKCWGSNQYGQLGNGTTTSSLTPIVVPGLNGVKQLSAGQLKTCALLDNGTVSCWGSLNGNNDLFTSPVRYSNFAGVEELSVGVTLAGGCVRLTGGTVRCWVDGQAPADVAGITNAVSISTGYGHACAALATGVVKCWTRFGSASDPQVTGATGISGAVTVGSGNDFSCARSSAGVVSCWGSNPYGELGTGTGGTASAIAGLNAATLSLGSQYACVLTATGGVSCWGSNFKGQIGDGSAIMVAGNDRFSPVAVTVLP